MAEPDVEPPSTHDIFATTTASIQEQVWAGRTRRTRVTIEEVDDEEEEGMGGVHHPSEDEDDGLEMEPEEYTAISDWDRLQEDNLREYMKQRAYPLMLNSSLLLNIILTNRC